MTDELNKLAERVEAASEAEQRAMLRLAFEAIHPVRPSGHNDRAWSAKCSLFDGFLDAFAWESAAMTLVPDGWGLKVRRWSADMTGAAGCYPPGCAGEWINAATPALALCAAALRALAQKDQSHEG